MPDIGVRLEIDPETFGKLTSGTGGLWSAVHDDGSKNRINEDAVMEAATLSFSLAALTAGFQWLKKKFRNRGKTKDDLEAEKEEAHVNRAAAALEEMLMEYIRAAREGSVDEESLEELIDTLEETHGYYQCGKLKVTDEKALTEILKSIASYTDAIAQSRGKKPVPSAGASGADEFLRIREQLILQKKLIA